MKRIFLLYIATLSALLCGCNRDVFINDYAPSAEEIKLSDTDSTVTVSFKASNWVIRNVFSTDEDGAFREVLGDIYAKDGHLIAMNSPFYMSEEETVKMVIDQPDIHLTIERTDETHLCFSKPENMNLEPMMLTVNVGNDYDEREISVELKPSSRYELDSIVYTLNPYTSQDSVIYRTNVITLINATPDVSTHIITPYKYFDQEYSFTDLYIMDTSYRQTELLKIFGKDAPTVPVPEIEWLNTNIIMQLVMKGTTMQLSETTQYLPTSEEKLKVHEEIPVDPYKLITCYMGCWYKQIGVDCDIYVSHPKSGKKRILKGTLEINTPQSYSLTVGNEQDFNIQ